MRHARRENPYTKRPDETPEEFNRRYHAIHVEEIAEGNRLLEARKAYDACCTFGPHKPRSSGSFAATIPVKPGEHAAFARDRRRPIHVRKLRAARRLANNGAMDPEGCRVPTKVSVIDRYALSTDELAEMLDHLWKLRFLGWLPKDTAYLEYANIQGFAEAETPRPNDTLRIMPSHFTSKRTAEELEAFRYA